MTCVEFSLYRMNFLFRSETIQQVPVPESLLYDLCSNKTIGNLACGTASECCSIRIIKHPAFTAKHTEELKRSNNRDEPEQCMDGEVPRC